MDSEERFEPEPFQVVSDPRQLKAFTDPLRNRLLHILSDKQATNQQLAAILNESQAKVLYHVRFLLDAGLIVLVDQVVRGGNVEKYYRATARIYGFRPDAQDAKTFSSSVSGAGLEAVTQELMASLHLWPDQPLYWEGRRARLSPERMEEFDLKLRALLAEYWGELDAAVSGDSDDPMMSVATVMYRFPAGGDK